MANLKKITFVTLFVADQQKAFDFYTKQLGFEPRADNPSPTGPRFLVVGVTRDDLNVLLWPSPKGEPARALTNLPGNLFIETDDCAAAFKELSANGVRFQEAHPVRSPYGTYATALDPDGNRISIRQA